MSFLATALLAMPVVAAERETCDQTGFSVEADTPVVTELVCDVVDRALPRLQACHLDIRAPVHIVVSDNLAGVPDGCIALFVCEQNEIRIGTVDSVSRTLLPESLFSSIEKNVFFESILVHEMAHAFFEQNACDRAKCAENHEYVAHAMQMAWLPEKERARIVAAYPVEHPIDPLRLNAFIAAFAPDRYAATVWQHFSLAENGCEIVRRLVAGEQSLQLMPR